MAKWLDGSSHHKLYSVKWELELRPQNWGFRDVSTSCIDVDRAVAIKWYSRDVVMLMTMMKVQGS